MGFFEIFSVKSTNKAIRIIRKEDKEETKTVLSVKDTIDQNFKISNERVEQIIKVNSN